MIALPQFLLYAESGREPARGDWRFLLESLDGSTSIEAADFEPRSGVERLALLSVVRGLESLDQPARVTVLTPSSYVSRGLVHGLDEWRENGWVWEAFGQMVPVKNRDLWQRVDHARRFHQLACRRWRIDEPHCRRTSPCQSTATGHAQTAKPPWKRSLRRSLLEYRRQTEARLESVRLGFAQWGTGLVPSPWLSP